MRNDKTLKRRQAAKFLGINIRTLDRWRHDGNGPAYLDLSLGSSHKPSIRYCIEDLEEFLNRARCCPKSDSV